MTPGVLSCEARNESHRCLVSKDDIKKMFIHNNTAGRAELADLSNFDGLYFISTALSDPKDCRTGL